MKLVYMNTSNRFKTTLEIEQNDHKFIKSLEISIEHSSIFKDLTLKSGILNFTEYVNADLLGKSTHGRNGFAYFFDGL